MTQPESKLTVGGTPVSQLREVLKMVDSDEALMSFLHNYSIGSAAEQFVAIMVDDGQRASFFVALAQTYPKDWQEAVELLSKQGK